MARRDLRRGLRVGGSERASREIVLIMLALSSC
jgi:hypothetical protein